jgi:hypothetical protein
MDQLGDQLTTSPIQTGCEFPMEPYPSGQFGFIDNPDRQFGNGSVRTPIRTRNDGPEPMLTLTAADVEGTIQFNELQWSVNNLWSCKYGNSPVT